MHGLQTLNWFWPKDKSAQWLAEILTFVRLLNVTGYWNGQLQFIVSQQDNTERNTDNGCLQVPLFRIQNNCYLRVRFCKFIQLRCPVKDWLTAWPCCSVWWSGFGLVLLTIFFFFFFLYWEVKVCSKQDRIIIIHQFIVICFHTAVTFFVCFYNR